MRIFILALMASVYFSSEMAMAYASQVYGHGVWPGAQNCGYGPQTASALYDKDYEYRELQKEIKESQKLLNDFTREKNKLSRNLKNHKKDAERFLKPYAANQVVDHIENGRREIDYKGENKNQSPACSSEGNPLSVSSEFCVESAGCKAAPSGRPIGPIDQNDMGCVPNPDKPGDFKRDEWTNSYIKGKSDGYVNDAICSKIPAEGRTDQSRCKKWINEYSKDATDHRVAEREIENLKDKIKYLKRDLSDRKNAIKDEVEDGTFVESDDDDTEAGDCPTCSWVSKNSETIRLVAGIGLPILGAYMGYKGAQNISEQNARLGWPTSPGMASGMAYPFIMQGLYGGIMGGLSAGGYGCAGGYYGGGMGGGMYGGMGGAFGYPQGMFGPGAMMGGMMGGYPMGGMIGGVIGAMMGGYPMGGMMMGGYPMGGMMGGAIGAMMGGYPMGGMMMGGYPMGGMMGGAIGAMMGGYPMGGYPMGGMMGGAIGAMMGGYPMGGMMGGAIGAMMGGYPMGGMMGGAIGAMMGGYPMGGMMGGAIGAMMGGYPMGGMMGSMMGGYPAGGMMGGYPMGGMMGAMMGGYPAGGMMGGYPMGGMMGSMMGGGVLGGSQLQQQYMQMYMQQQQQQMQLQMQAQQEYMQKQQVVGRLTQELYKIQLQIQQISSGTLYGGSYPYSVYPTTGTGTTTTPTGGSGSVILGR